MPGMEVEQLELGRGRSAWMRAGPPVDEEGEQATGPRCERVGEFPPQIGAAGPDPVSGCRKAKIDPGLPGLLDQRRKVGGFGRPGDQPWGLKGRDTEDGGAGPEGLLGIGADDLQVALRSEWQESIPSSPRRVRAARERSHTQGLLQVPQRGFQIGGGVNQVVQPARNQGQGTFPP